jgi:transcriptional regulator
MVTKKGGHELLRGTLDMMILKTLTHGHMHGYAITKFLERVSGDFFQIEEGTLYPALQRLELDGFIVGEWQRTPNNRRARFYRLTAAGQKHLRTETERYQAVTLAIARAMGTA